MPDEDRPAIEADGSLGERGHAIDSLKKRLEAGEQVDRIIAIGCTFMMYEMAETTRGFGVKTTVSLNPIMIDGTGMCGGCRVKVGEETKFTCVDGPEFDGHTVDWDLLGSRQRRPGRHIDLDLEGVLIKFRKTDEF